MKNGDRVQVLPDYVLIRRENQVLRDKVKDLQFEVQYLLGVNVDANRVISKKNEEIAALKFERRLG